jgi:hypothetical protein
MPRQALYTSQKMLNMTPTMREALRRAAAAKAVDESELIRQYLAEGLLADGYDHTTGRKSRVGPRR